MKEIIQANEYFAQQYSQESSKQHQRYQMCSLECLKMAKERASIWYLQASH